MPELTPSRLLLVLTALMCLLLSACPAEESEGPTSPVPDREEMAADIAEHADLISEFDQVRAIVAATDGRIVFEEYYGTDQDGYWGLQSVTKSVLSTLVGIALDEGLIGSLDDTLVHLLPGYADDMSPAVADTTLRQLLTMTAGFPSGVNAPAPDFTLSQDWVRWILKNPESPPGGSFVYSNGTSHLIAAVLQEATGTSALAYARSRLFGPLGIDTRPAMQDVFNPDEAAQQLTAYGRAGFAWPRDPQGVSTGWWGIKLRPRDMVKLGQLFLADGRWDGRQLVPAEWVDQATTQQVAADGTVQHGDGYGYQWWTGTVDGDEAFRAIGYGGQIIEVVPDRDLVVVTASEVRLGDPTSRGIDANVLLHIVEDAVVAQFPSG